MTTVAGIIAGSVCLLGFVFGIVFFYAAGELNQQGERKDDDF